MMNSSDRTTMKLLDELEGEMDNHDGKQYAQMEEAKNVQVISETPKEAPAVDPKMGLDSKEKKTYLNPDREKILKESEAQEAKVEMPVRGQFGRSKKGYT